MYGLLLADRQRPQKTFMQKFLEGITAIPLAQGIEES